jgi:hypothetical protein
MRWDRDPLLSKAKVYFGLAFAEPRDSPLFGLWCSLGLEFLMRAAVASVSPTLLAEPDQQHRFLLHALNRGAANTPARSVSTAQVIALCRTLFKEFSDQDATACHALANRRNDELHTGVAAFEEFQPKHWLAAFYRSCDSLATVLGESLKSLFGTAEAGVARKIIDQVRQDVKQRVESAIAAHRRVFLDKPEEERLVIATQVAADAEKSAYERHHKVSCPSCGCVATVQGKVFGRSNVTHDGDEMAVSNLNRNVIGRIAR